MKSSKNKSRTHVEDPVWCDECQIRIAPYEEAVSAGKRTVHKRCFLKTGLREPQPERLNSAGLNFAIT